MEAKQEHLTKGSYGGFAIELVIDFVIMYFVMYTMVATVDHLYLNINNVYMTLMMVAPMAIIMLVSMRSMFSLALAELDHRSCGSSRIRRQFLRDAHAGRRGQ